MKNIKELIHQIRNHSFAPITKEDLYPESFLSPIWEKHGKDVKCFPLKEEHILQICKMINFQVDDLKKRLLNFAEALIEVKGEHFDAEIFSKVLEELTKKQCNILKEELIDQQRKGVKTFLPITKEELKNSLIKEIVGEEKFDKAVKSSKLVMVDLFGTYCPPCKTIMPIIEKAVAHYVDRDDFLPIKVNLQREENFPISKLLSVVALPSFVFFKEGKEIARYIGKEALDLAPKLVQKIDELMAN